MLNYHFNKKLVSTDEILRELDLPVSTLNFWKTQWRKRGLDCWDMGLIKI
jgi:transposase-like protein